MKKIFTILDLMLCLSLVFSSSCKESIVEPSVSNSFLVDSASYLPSQLVVLTVDNSITRDTFTTTVGNVQVLLSKISPQKYGFILPILVQGNYVLNLKGLDAATNPIITVKAYTVITNPTSVVTQFQSQISAKVDTLQKTSANNSAATQEVLFFKQTIDQLNSNLKTATESQKLAFAYYVQQINLNESVINSASIDTTYLTKVKKSANTSIIPEISTLANNKVAQILARITLASKAAKLVTISGALTAYMPNPWTASAFLAAVIHYGMQMDKVSTQMAEYAATAYVDKDISVIDNSSSNKVVSFNHFQLTNVANNSSVVNFYDGQPIWQKLSGTFRTVSQKDASDLNLGNGVNAENNMQQEDNALKSSFQSIINGANYIFDKIKEPFKAYSPQIKTIAMEKKLPINYSYVTISNISNSSIVLTAIDDGVNGLKIIATNPDKSITNSTTFTYQLTYTQAAINNKVSVTQQATYVPVVITTTAISNVTPTTAVTGGNIISDGGSTITARGICWATTKTPTINNFTIQYGSGIGTYSGICNNLIANTTYYVRAFATNVNGTFYGNEISFTTPSAVRTGITVAGGNGWGTASNQFRSTYSVFVDNSDNIYIADGDNSRIQKWIPGVASGITVSGGNGVGSKANQLSSPYGIYVDGSSNIYVADCNNHRIQRWSQGATGVTVAGETLFGNCCSGAGDSINQLYGPKGVFVDGGGNIYIADQGNGRIQKWAPGATFGATVAGFYGKRSGVALPYSPSCVFVDGNGNIYFADDNRILKWSQGATSGVIVAGGNGNGAAANQLFAPQGIYVDGSGNIYIADFNNHRIQKWVPGATTGITVAGGNGMGAAANQLSFPYGVFVDGSGYIYIADNGNQRIQKWPPM